MKFTNQNLSKLHFMLALLILTHFTNTKGDTLYVGPNETYTTITAAISSASAGDTIIVKDGTYDEDITVDKSITIQAENLHAAIIGDGSGSEGVIRIGKIGGVSDVTVAGLKLNDLDGLGILVGDAYTNLTTTNCTIKNNYIQNRKYSIVITDYCNNATISNNTIVDDKARGLGVSGTGTYSIINNTIQNCGKSGISMKDSFSGLATIIGNTLKWNTRNGVRIQNNNVTLQGNTIAENIQAGVFVDGGLSNIVIDSNNQINSNGQQGIIIETSSTATIENNTINENGDHGITIYGSATISGNTINLNGNNGVYIPGSATVQNNIIQYNSICGIEAEEGATNVMINDNHITNNNLDGLLLRAAATVQENIVNGNEMNGIEVTEAASKVTLSKNDIINNNTGITSATTIKLRWNRIENNTDVGISIFNSGVDLGQNSESEAGNNVIRNNTNWNVVNSTPDTVSAYRNYWGFTNTVDIDATIKDDDEDGTFGPMNFDPFLIEDPATPVRQLLNNTIIPKGTELEPAYPNPFNQATRITYKLSKPAKVTLKVVDITGQIVQTIIGGEHQVAGSYSTIWNGRANLGHLVSSGMYMLILKTELVTKTQSVIFVK